MRFCSKLAVWCVHSGIVCHWVFGLPLWQSARIAMWRIRQNSGAVFKKFFSKNYPQNFQKAKMEFRPQI
jgi:hypothetical protein